MQFFIQSFSCCCCYVASVMSDSVRPHRWQTTRLLRPWDSPGKNTGVGCHFLLQCMLSLFSCVQLCVTLWTAAHQAPLSTGFSRREYRSGLPFPSPHSPIGRHLFCFQFSVSKWCLLNDFTHVPNFWLLWNSLSSVVTESEGNMFFKLAI